MHESGSSPKDTATKTNDKEGLKEAKEGPTDSGVLVKGTNNKGKTEMEATMNKIKENAKNGIREEDS
eukprot:787186-Ditylum_brightwellii.AAC.1